MLKSFLWRHRFTEFVQYWYRTDSWRRSKVSTVFCRVVAEDMQLHVLRIGAQQLCRVSFRPTLQQTICSSLHISVAYCRLISVPAGSADSILKDERIVHSKAAKKIRYPTVLIFILSWMYWGADKSLAWPGRKQANVYFRMAWISFGALPCKQKMMTASVSMLLKSRASLTCFRACFLPGRAKDLSAHRCSVVFEWSDGNFPTNNIQT